MTLLTNPELVSEEIGIGIWKRSSFIAGLSRREDVQKKAAKMSNNPDRSYGWYKAHDFNDYMERIIGNVFISTFIFILLSRFFFQSFQSFSILLNPANPGEYGSELEQMGFNDESETDYLDSIKFCADLVWHGEIFN